MTLGTSGWNTPDQAMVILSRLVCRDGARKGGGHATGGHRGGEPDVAREALPRS